MILLPEIDGRHFSHAYNVLFTTKIALQVHIRYEQAFG